jgi:hypothetical protein
MRVTQTTNPHLVAVAFGVQEAGKLTNGYSFTVKAGSTHTVLVTSDPVKHELAVSLDGMLRFSRTTVQSEEPISVDPSTSRQGNQGSALLVTDATAGSPEPTLCESLIH